MTTTTLQSVDDVLALALDCGNDLNLISSVAQCKPLDEIGLQLK